MFTLHKHNQERKSGSCLSQKCVLSSNHLCAGQLSPPMGIFQWHIKTQKEALMKLLKIEKPERPEANQAMAPSERE